MTTYRVKITGDKYPTEYIVQAGGWATGIARAIREWKKRFKGSRTQELRITALKTGNLLIADKENGKE